MSSLEKVSVYLDAFQPGDANYDFACYIKEKLAEASMVNTEQQTPTHEEENNNAKEMETSEFDKTNQNLEGKLMSPAFQDLDALNQIDEEKKEIKTAESLKSFLAKIRRD